MDSDLLRLSLRLFKRKTVCQVPGQEKTEDSKIPQPAIQQEVCVSWVNDCWWHFLVDFALPVLVLMFRTGWLESSCRRWKKILRLYTDKSYWVWMWIKGVKIKDFCVKFSASFVILNLTL